MTGVPKLFIEQLQNVQRALGALLEFKSDSDNRSFCKISGVNDKTYLAEEARNGLKR